MDIGNIIGVMSAILGGTGIVVFLGYTTAAYRYSMARVRETEDADKALKLKHEMELMIQNEVKRQLQEQQQRAG